MIVLNGVSLPKSISPQVVARMYHEDQKGLEEFMDRYNEAKIVRYGNQKPSEHDFMLAKRHLEEGVPISQIAKEGKASGLTAAKITGAVLRVTRQKYLEGLKA